jgi:F0F1-type ATP synthase membrane subunit b/b'
MLRRRLMLRPGVTRRATFALALGLAFASYALPQESPAAAKTSEAEQGDRLIWWKWANFAILAAGLGYLIFKNVPPLFRKQTDEIQAALAESAKIKKEAAEYAAGVEARLADLQKEIQKLRENAHAEMIAESERIRHETEHHVQRIREQSAQEVALMTRAAKAELQKYAAELAIGLAEERIRFRMNPEIQDRLVNGFLRDMHGRVAPRTAN